MNWRTKARTGNRHERDARACSERASSHRGRATRSNNSRRGVGPIATVALVMIAGALVWPYVRGFFRSASKMIERAVLQPPLGAPARPPSSKPDPDERVRLDEQWREALRQPFADLRAYADKLDKIERAGFRALATQWQSKGNTRAYQEGFRSKFDKLYSDLSSGHITFHMYGDFDPYAIEKLEDELRELQAKLKRACEYLDREHVLTMEERRKHLANR